MARQPRGDSPEPDDPLEAAAKRLERAVSVLDTRLSSVKEEVRQSAGSAFDDDRSKLAQDLDRASARERELRAAGEEASQALARAIEQVRSVVERAEAS